MHSFVMQLETVTTFERFETNLAAVGSFYRVDFHVNLQTASVLEFFPANCARKNALNVVVLTVNL